MLTDETGTVVWQEELSPFGETNGEVGTLHYLARFTGKGMDEETGLYYFNARWYSAEIGRFISVDPARQGANWFIYALNNPLMLIDPDGKEPTPAPALYIPKPAYMGNIGEFLTREMLAKLALAARYKSTIQDPATQKEVIRRLTVKFGTLDTNANPGVGFLNTENTIGRDWDLSYSKVNFDFLETKGVTQTKYEAGMDKDWFGRFLFFSNANVFFNDNSNSTSGYYTGFEPIQNLPNNPSIENILGLQTGSMQNQTLTTYGNFNKTTDSNFNIGFTTPGKITLAEGWDTIFNNIIFPISGGLAKGIPAAYATASVNIFTSTKDGDPYWSIMAPIPNPNFEAVSGDMYVPTKPRYLTMEQLMYYYPDFAVDLAVGLAVGEEMKQ
jgi:RHS repeat-associated protein